MPTGGHAGEAKTFSRLSSNVFSKDMRRDVHNYISTYTIF